MRWQDESWDAPTQAPVGFAMPPADAIGDIVYRPGTVVDQGDAPAPTGFAAPPEAAPPLDALVPAPQTPRDPTQPFQQADRVDDSPAWDPRRPLTVGGTTSDDDVWPTDEDGHPDFPPPTGAPVLATPAWRTPAQPAPNRAQNYPAPNRTAPNYPQNYPASNYPASNYPAQSRPQNFPTTTYPQAPYAQPGYPAPAPTAPTPALGHIARPQPGPAPQPYPQPYTPARPWQDAAGPVPQYRPPAGQPSRVQFDWLTLVLLVAGALFAGWSWWLLVIAWIVAGARHTLRPAVALGFSICGPLLLVVWVITWISNQTGAITIYTVTPLYDIVARLCCVVLAAVLLIDFGMARSRHQ